MIIVQNNLEVILFMKKVGIQKGLKNVADYLTKAGYSVQELGESMENNASQLDNLDVVVTADYNTNMMGFSNTETKTPMINASGLTPEEVKNLIDKQNS